MGSKGLFSVLAAAAALAWTAPTAAQDDIMEKIINAPHPSAFTVQGLKTPPKPRNDASVQGGKALRIKFRERAARLGISAPAIRCRSR